MTEQQDKEAREVIERCNSWRIQLELVFDQGDEINDKHPGDTAKDFSMRALYRVRPELDKLLKTSQFTEYSIKVLPEPCVKL